MISSCVIINHSKKFIFIKTPKTGGSSVEFYLSQYCKEKDTITPLLKNEEKQKKKLKLPIKQNYKFKKMFLSSRLIKKFKFSKEIYLTDHTGINFLIKNIRINFNKYYIFTFVRNPYYLMESFFWWLLYYDNILTINKINNLSKIEINILFKYFLRKECSFWFKFIKDMIYNKNYKVHIYKYENIEKSISNIKNIFMLKNEKYKFNSINLKKLSINKKIKLKLKIDSEDAEIIKKEAKFFFEKFNYSKQIPKKFL